MTLKRTKIETLTYKDCNVAEKQLNSVAETVDCKQLISHAIVKVLIIHETIYNFSSKFIVEFIKIDWQRDSSVHDVDYESFDSILCSNRSQKSQEISIRRSSNDVRTLRDQESRHAEFSFMRQHSL